MHCDVRKVRCLADRHHKVGHLAKDANGTDVEAERRLRGREVAIAVVGSCFGADVDEELVGTGVRRRGDDGAVKPIHEDCLVCNCIGQGRFGHRVTVSPAGERGGVDEGATTLVCGSIGSIERVTHETGLLLGDEGRVCEVEEVIEGVVGELGGGWLLNAVLMLKVVTFAEIELERGARNEVRMRLPSVEVFVGKSTARISVG